MKIGRKYEKLCPKSLTQRCEFDTLIYIIFEKYEACTHIEELFQPVRLFFLETLSSYTVIQDYTDIREIRVEDSCLQ